MPLGTGTSVRTVPSVQRTGSESGITVSTLVLESRTRISQVSQPASPLRYIYIWAYSLPLMLTGAYLGVPQQSERREMYKNSRSSLQTERLAADRVKIRQRTQLVVRDLLAVLLLSLPKLGAELPLHVLVLTEKVQDS